PYVGFSQLKSGHGVQRVVGRLLRFWSARNVKKEGQLMGVDLLLIDESSTLMQGSIHLHHLSTFEPLLHEGSMYVITGFEVTRSNHRFKMTDFNLSIRFNERTSLVQIQESFCNIPTELFRFHSHQELPSIHIIGQVCTTKAYRNEATEALERMLVHLCLESGEKVWLSAFDAHATSLNQIFGTKEAGTCVMLATNINPKYFGGELYLNATAATKFYFDDEMEATRGFLPRLTSNYKDGIQSLEIYHGVQKIEHLTIAELNDFLIKSNLKEAEFLCTATVVDILSTNGWSYISCSKCAKKMTREQTTLTCNNCHSIDAVGDVKYRVELVVDDGTTGSVFVAFDKDMVKLTNMQASQIVTEQDDTHLNNSALPQQILDIVGKKFTFHIKLTSFNFTTHHRSFTVSRIFDKLQDAPKPTFVEKQPVHVNLGTNSPASTRVVI
ncbi:unnamed protein product, partial [Thlaspi arvense]